MTFLVKNRIEFDLVKSTLNPCIGAILSFSLLITHGIKNMKNKIYPILSVLLIGFIQTGFGQWSTASLSQARFAFTAASENGKVLFECVTY